MQLSWMGEYREVVEALIHYCNIYAAVYKAEKLEYEDIRYSYAQVQVLEYLLENEERCDNMSAIASRLGITRSNFSKIASRLRSKGLLEKDFIPGSRKEVKLRVNQRGRDLYEAYARGILNCHFAPMFSKLEKIPQPYYPLIRDALNAAMGGSTLPEAAEEDDHESQ